MDIQSVVKVMALETGRAGDKVAVLEATVAAKTRLVRTSVEEGELAARVTAFEPSAVVWMWRSSHQPLLELACPQYACSWYDGAVAGAFRGQSGMLLQLEDAGRCLLILREEHNQTRTFFHPEGSLTWLAELARQTVASPQLSPTSRQRFQRTVDFHANASAICQQLQDLADYPGPDPAALAALSKAGRTLCDFVRAGRSRGRLSPPIRAAWSDWPMEGPLWDQFASEAKRYLPEVRWKPPQGDAGLGALLLWEGQREEDRRLQALGREVKVMRDLGEDAWRHLKRGGRWLDPWKDCR